MRKRQSSYPQSLQRHRAASWLDVVYRLLWRCNTSVRIKTAKVFLEDFYTSVAAHKPIDWATQMARNAISQEFDLDNREFATPVLYMRAKDGNVF